MYGHRLTDQRRQHGQEPPESRAIPGQKPAQKVAITFVFGFLRLSYGFFLAFCPIPFPTPGPFPCGSFGVKFCPKNFRRFLVGNLILPGSPFPLPWPCFWHAFERSRPLASVRQFSERSPPWFFCPASPAQAPPERAKISPNFPHHALCLSGAGEPFPLLCFVPVAVPSPRLPPCVRESFPPLSSIAANFLVFNVPGAFSIPML